MDGKNNNLRAFIEHLNGQEMHSIVTLDPTNKDEEVGIMSISNVSRWIYFANKIEYSYFYTIEL